MEITELVVGQTYLVQTDNGLLKGTYEGPGKVLTGPLAAFIFETGSGAGFTAEEVRNLVQFENPCTFCGEGETCKHGDGCTECCLDCRREQEADELGIPRPIVF